MRVLIFLVVIACWACQSSAPDRSAFKLQVNYPVALLDVASEQGNELEKLKKGDRVIDLMQVSTLVSSIYLEDSLFTGPWIKVQTQDQKQGWVFSGALQLLEADRNAQEAWQLQKRFEAHFGKQLTQEWQAWSQQESPATDSAFAQILTTGIKIRDTLNQLIARQVSRDATQRPPDFFWLSQFSPYFLIQQLNAGTGYCLFIDYRKVSQTTLHTSGQQDDQFVAAALAAFPLDSIESALPAWVFPLSLEESASNLGVGQHWHCLQVIDRAWQSGPLFHQELRRMTEQLLADMLNNDRRYWQPKEKILAELNKITTSTWTCLDNRDRLALEARLNIFEQAEQNGLVLNLRAGN